MSKSFWGGAKWAIIAPGAVLLFIAFFFVALFAVKLLWEWTVPELFPGAVQQGLIAGTISYLAALKLLLFVVIISALTGLRGKCKS